MTNTPSVVIDKTQVGDRVKGMYQCARSAMNVLHGFCYVTHIHISYKMRILKYEEVKDDSTKILSVKVNPTVILKQAKTNVTMKTIPTLYISD